MKHFIASTAVAIVLTATLASLAEAAGRSAESRREIQTTQCSAPESVFQLVDPTNDDDQDPTTMTGSFRIWGLAHGYVYFSVNGVPVRMLEAAFPNPIPPNGTIVTVTGLTRDSDGGYTCTGIR